MAEQVNMSSSSSKRQIAAKSGQSGAKSGEKKALELSDGKNLEMIHFRESLK